MANTLIQIKRSTVTAVPPNGSLSEGEQAYSYLSDKLFIGDSAGSGIIEIGGRFYNNIAVRAYDISNAAFAYANTLSSDADEKANAAIITANLAFDRANAANLLAFNTGIGANAFASATIAGANTAVGAGANAYANLVWSRSNTRSDAIGVSANAFTSATIAGANTAVGAGANAFASATIAGANAAVGLGANTYADATFVKLTTPNQTITSNLSIVGSLTVSGNTTYVNVNDLRVSDPLLYLAANNYVSDIVDIGFIGNYVNSTGANVHTGLYREHVDKMYYLFQGYDAEPLNNHIGAFSNNMTLAVLNADLKTSNLVLGGANVITWITAAFDRANAANLLAFNTGLGANAFTSATIAGANTAVGAGANAYANLVWSRSNTRSDAIGVSANAFASATIAGANTAVGAGANAYANLVWSRSNTYADLVGAAANTNAANASYINTGTLRVNYGGTGLNTIANNGVVFGSGTDAVRTAATTTEGQVLQASQYGTPFFGMLDGGVF